jgi:ribosomal-protein-alanine N-acetyltransferase
VSAPTPFLAEGARTGIRPFTPGDAEEFAARARESRALHHPWLAPPTTPEAYAAYAEPLIDAGNDTRAGFLVCERGSDGGSDDGGAIAGYINVNNVVRGAFQCGALGYGAFAHAAGRGLMGEGMGLVIAYAFGPLGLHRLEANIQPGNAASIALVKKHGLRLEGFSPAFLYVDGAWRDHERWAVTAG